MAETGVLHARLSNGNMIIRQDRASKYRLVAPATEGGKSSAVSLIEVVALITADAGNKGLILYLRRAGGMAFDSRVRKALKLTIGKNEREYRV
jgi:hypothetical protein